MSLENVATKFAPLCEGLEEEDFSISNSFLAGLGQNVIFD
jgi:hypothetical protein